MFRLFADSSRITWAEAQFSFVNIVPAAPQLDVLRSGPSSQCVRIHMMEL